MKILFITSNRVGDAVLSTGLLRWLVDHYPDAQFTIACGPYAAGLFLAVPRLEKLVVLEKKSFNRHWLTLWSASVGTHWDLIVDLRNSLVSRLLFTKKLALRVRRPGQHKVIENAAVLGLDPPPAPHIYLDATAEREAMELLSGAGPVLALAPAANWPCKQWPIERFTALAQKLTGAEGPLANARILVIADAHERAQILPLLATVPAGKSIELFGKNLMTVAACLKQAKLFVGNDSGLMHVAAAVGAPTLGLFGPGYEELYGPWGPHCAFVRTVESRAELLSRIPDTRAREPNLMGGLSVEAVEQAAQKLLTSQPS